MKRDVINGIRIMNKRGALYNEPIKVVLNGSVAKQKQKVKGSKKIIPPILSDNFPSVAERLPIDSVINILENA